jgi:hypothetical protein
LIGPVAEAAGPLVVALVLALIGSQVYDVSPEMSECGGQSECAGFMLMARWTSEERERQRLVAVAVGVRQLMLRGDGSGAPVIGLGIDEDLWRNEANGAITYVAAGWQRAKLTTVPWALAESDRSAFMKSFREAAANASAIRFDITTFERGKVPGGVTEREMNHILSQPQLLGKTAFWERDQEMTWNGTKFVPKR